MKRALVCVATLLIFCNTTYSQDSQLELKIVDFDNPDIHVGATLILKGSDTGDACRYNAETDNRLGVTRSGVVVLSNNCKSGERLLIRSDGDIYYNECGHCPLGPKSFANTFAFQRISENQYEIRLTRISNLSTLKAKAESENLVDREDFATAAFAYNELMNRTLSVQSYKLYKKGTFIQTAKAFGLDPGLGLNCLGSECSLSSALKERIIIYQKENNINPTGILGVDTLSSLSGKNSHNIIYETKTPIEAINDKSKTKQGKYEEFNIDFNKIDQSQLNIESLREYLDERQLEATYSRLENALRLERLNQHQKAAQIFNDLTHSLKRRVPYDSSLINTLEAKVYENFGAFLKIKDPLVYDPLQKKLVLSPKFVSKIKELQIDNGLKVDGVLGPKTLRLSPKNY